MGKRGDRFPRRNTEHLITDGMTVYTIFIVFYSLWINFPINGFEFQKHEIIMLYNVYF